MGNLSPLTILPVQLSSADVMLMLLCIFGIKMKRENLIGGTALVYWNASLFHSIPSLISLSAVRVSELMVLKLFHILPSLSFWRAVHWWESETLNSSLCESIPLPSQISGMKMTSVAAKYVRLITNERYKVRLCPSIYPLLFQPSFSFRSFYLLSSFEHAFVRTSNHGSVRPLPL